MQIVSVLYIMGLIASVASAASTMPSTVPSSVPSTQAGADTRPFMSVPQANNAFAVDLYARLAGQPGNLFFSPYSIETALAMTSAGARGPTAAEMAKVLHLDPANDKLHADFAALIKELNGGGRIQRRASHQLVVANALWGQLGYPFHKDFQALLKAQYAASLNEVDFAGALEDSRNLINAWVERQTNDKIKDLIQAGALDPLTRLVLVNAIYFKARWADDFPKSATNDEPFRVSADKTAPIPMMRQEDRFPCLDGEQVQVLEMPYVGGQLSMLVILPRTVDGLPAVEKALRPETVDEWARGMKVRKVDVSMPKFRFTSQFSLSPVLRDMGMAKAFSAAEADFSGIASVEKLFIGAVIHKAFVDVNEEGTEAAAATAVGFPGAALPPPEEPLVFKADHPFLFLIRHRTSGTILFLGRVVAP